MTDAQFVDYVSKELPGLKLVGFRQSKIVYLTDTKYGVLLYGSVNGVSPSVIEVQPTFKLKLTLLGGDTSEAIVRKTISPSAPPSSIVLSGQYTTTGGIDTAFNKTLDQFEGFPLNAMEGFLYFETTKTAGQKPTIHKVIVEDD